MPDRPRVRVWCEDREHEGFARKLLTSLGVWGRDINVTLAPAGKGAASAWVQEQFAQIQREARATRHQATLGFLVVIDGDNVGVAGRLIMLGANSRGDFDRIAVFVPTWSIETWVLWLSGETLSERDSVKGQVDAARFRELLGPAIEAWRAPRSDEAASVPSLTAARQELRRLPV